MPLPHLTIFTPCASPRLSYVLDWLFTKQLGFTYALTQSSTEAAASRYCIAYGTHCEGAFQIAATSLLQETGIIPHFINRRAWQGLHALYFDEASDADIPFDLFSGIFYLLTRYEEYFKTPRDEHGRFSHADTILAMDGVLERPVIDEWVTHLRQLLEARWNIQIPKPAFTIALTYDIDIAWAYRHKGAKRLLGAALRDVASLKFASVAQRFSAHDPYDAFGWMQELHKRADSRPRYFILAADQASPFDKNISPHHPAMQALIKRLADEAPIGLHPSYYSSEKPALLKSEKRVLEAITAKTITTSRQHYIRLSFPHTYRLLMANGITDDYSMGYSTHTGFRAGTSQSFDWYDVELESATSLRIHPFCFMDTTAHYDMHLSTAAAFEKLDVLAAALRPVGGTLTTIFHNFSLGTDREWRGWREAYERFLLSGL